MGFFSKVEKAVKKGWKDVLGWADDKETLTIGTAVALGALTGGLGAAALGASNAMIAGGALVGSAAGGLKGAGDVKSMHAQEKAQEAQLAAAQRLADAQNPANVVSAVTPTAGMENAQISEESMAADAKRRYSFGKALYKRNLLGRTQGGNITKQILG